MRRLTLGTLTTLMLTLGIAPIAQGETQMQGYHQHNVRSTEAFNLVTSAYRGEFKSEGIPSYNKLQEAYESHQIDAETLVNSAIAAGELSPAKMKPISTPLASILIV